MLSRNRSQKVAQFGARAARLPDVSQKRSGLRAVPEPVQLDDLLVETGNGSRSAYDTLYGLVIGRVFGLAKRVLRDPSMAEEVAQEVMVEIWKKAPNFDPELGTATSWVSMIAHRRAVDRVRSEQARRDREARTFEHDGDQSELDDALIANEERAEVTSALSELTPTQRTAIELAFYEGKTHTEVSEVLDIPLGTAKTRIRDGLTKLRKVVTESEGDRDDN